MQAACARDADDGQGENPFPIVAHRLFGHVVRAEAQHVIKLSGPALSLLRLLHHEGTKHKPVFQCQQNDIETCKIPKHGHRRTPMRSEYRIEGTLRMPEMQEQGRRYEYHQTEGGEHGEMRHRLERLQAEHLIQTRDREGPGHQPGEVRIDDDQHSPGEYRLVGIDVAGERRGQKLRVHHSTSLSMPT